VALDRLLFGDSEMMSRNYEPSTHRQRDHQRDEITRKTLPSFGPALEPAASNVIPLAKR
jgi:hypothetical protein